MNNGDYTHQKTTHCEKKLIGYLHKILYFFDAKHLPRRSLSALPGRDKSIFLKTLIKKIFLERFLSFYGMNSFAKKGLNAPHLKTLALHLPNVSVRLAV